jgi:hypothetical protein
MLGRGRLPPIRSGVSFKKEISLRASWPSSFLTVLHPTCSVAPLFAAPSATSTTVLPHRLLAAPTRHHAVPPRPRLLPHALDHWGPPAPWTQGGNQGLSAARQLPFFRSVRHLLKLDVGAIFSALREDPLADLAPLLWATAFDELHTSTSLHSPRQQGDVALKAHVASVCFKCFRYFRGMLQVFHTDIAKVDQNVACVAMIVHVCCKCLQTYVASVFICMLHMSSHICANVLYACCVCLQYFSSVFRCSCKCFRRMF